ncbi:hypothetical protein [Spiroplasma endosymbiont of Tricholauxania praeusta]
MTLDNATKINQIILDNNNSKNVEEEYDMLDDAKEAINDEDEWAIIDLPSYGSNHI